MIIAGTGHRPNKLGGYSKEAFNNLVSIAQDYLSSMKTHYYQEEIKVISGMALGWDQALAQAAINLNIPFIAAIPCYNQDKMWPLQSKKYYNNLLNNKLCEIVQVNSCEYNNSCMQIRNEWMVNNCHMLLAIHDGTSGGTKNCIDYANKKKITIINIYNRYKQNN